MIRTTLAVALAAALAIATGCNVTSLVETATAATPQQKRIAALTQQVHRQQVAINKRNATITTLRTTLANATTDRDTARAAITSSITGQISVLNAASLVPIIDAIGARVQALDSTLNNVAKSVLVSGTDTFYAWSLSLHVGAGG